MFGLIISDPSRNADRRATLRRLLHDYDLPLTAIDEFEEKGKTDPLFAELDRMCKANHGLWNPEAEKFLLANAKKI